MRQHWRSWAALIVFSSVPFTPRTRTGIFADNPATNVPANMLRNSPFCFLFSFSSFLLTPSIYQPNSLRDLTIFMMFSISQFKIISVIAPDSFISFWIAASFADAATIKSNVIKTTLANGKNTFFNNKN